VTHQPEDAPAAEAAFTSVKGLDEALAQTPAAADGKDISIMGGEDVIRQTLHVRYLDELAITIAPVVMGGGKRVFDSFDESLTMVQTCVR
jgi:dihydrofolate reductase